MSLHGTRRLRSAVAGERSLYDDYGFVPAEAARIVSARNKRPYGDFSSAKRRRGRLLTDWRVHLQAGSKLVVVGLGPMDPSVMLAVSTFLVRK